MRRLALSLLILAASAARAQTVNIFGAISAPESAGHVTATIKLSAPSANAVTVDYATSDDTAKAGVNYTATSGTLVFNPGETTKAVDVPIFDNDLWGDDGRQFLFSISNATGGATIGSQSQIYAVLIEDDPEPVITVTGNTVVEGSGTRTIQLKLTLSGKSAQAVTVGLHRIILPFDVGELNGLNVTPLGGATFSPEETEKFVAVDVTGNNTWDGAASHTWHIVWETFNALIGDTPVTLVEDDPVPNVTVSDVSVIEGTGTTTTAKITFTSDLPVNGIIDYSLREGTASIGSDFLVPFANQGRVRWGGSETVKVVEIGIVTDSIAEPNETFFFVIAAAQRMNLNRTSVTVTIVDDDTPAPARAEFSPPLLSLFAGGTATVAVSLVPAQTTATQLQLQSSSAMLVVPASVSVPAGGTATFQVSALGAGAATIAAAGTTGALQAEIANPTVAGINPGSVMAGTQLELAVSGEGFSGSCRVVFDGLAAPTRFVDSHTLLATTPLRAAGAAQVAVTCGAASIPAPQPLRFFEPRRRPSRH